ncbi:MAG: hypothetical protein ACTSYA_12185 [Candidatus Kariarchaeaceae archaeon]
MSDQDATSLKEEIYMSRSGYNLTPQKNSIKHKKWLRPVIGSLIIFLLIFLVFKLFVYAPKSLQLSGLSQEDPPEVVTPDLSLWERIKEWYNDNKFDLPDFDFNTDGNDGGGGGILGDIGSSIGNLLLVLLISLVIVAIIIGLYRVFGSFKGIAFKAYEKKEKSKEQKITALSEKIKKILVRIDQLYEEGEFSQGIIIGYQMLDDALSDYIQLRRRKYDTPLEHVLQSDELFPINKIILQSIVDEFYVEQYAMEGLATKTNLEVFRQMIVSLIPEIELDLITTNSNSNFTEIKGKEDQNEY